MKTLSEIELPTDQQPIATCARYVVLHGAVVSLIKLIFHMKNKKKIDLKLQHRISRKNSFSRSLENAKSRNVLMQLFSMVLLKQSSRGVL